MKVVDRHILRPNRITQGSRFSQEIVAFFRVRKRLDASI